MRTWNEYIHFSNNENERGHKDKKSRARVRKDEEAEGKEASLSLIDQLDTGT